MSLVTRRNANEALDLAPSQFRHQLAPAPLIFTRYSEYAVCFAAWNFSVAPSQLMVESTARVLASQAEAIVVL